MMIFFCNLETFVVTIRVDDPELIYMIRRKVEFEDAIRRRKRCSTSFLASAIEISENYTKLTAQCKDFRGVMHFLDVFSSEFDIEREVHQVCGTIRIEKETDTGNQVLNLYVRQ